MSYLTNKQRLKIALGGLISLIGLAILILTLLIVTQKIEIKTAFEYALLVNVILVIGALDVLAGILLLIQYFKS